LNIKLEVLKQREQKLDVSLSTQGLKRSLNFRNSLANQLFAMQIKSINNDLKYPCLLKPFLGKLRDSLLHVSLKIGRAEDRTKQERHYNNEEDKQHFLM